ncbi:MAG: DNA polymerase III subunit delta [Sphingobacteriaceae bacterium]|nr:MAG: DNA polymerase III subunit delta [Pedobacter sp.]
MDIRSLCKDIVCRKFKPVYLLHGEEPYYIDQISNLLEEQVLSENEKGFNQTILYGKDTDMLSILNAAKRFPMMSDYQLILVREAQDLKWAKGAEDDKKAVNDPLLAYVENPLSSTILVFCYKYGKFDKRKRIYKAIDKNGLVFESATIYPDKVAAWIEDFVGQKKYRIQVQALALLAEYLGNDLSKIANELNKLMLSIPSTQEITMEDVQANIGISKAYNVFELQTALARRDVLKANQIIHYFAKNPKSNPMVLLLGTLNNYFTKILRYHYLTDKSPQSLAKELGVHPFFVREYEFAGKNYSKDQIFRVISHLRESDLKTKGVGATGNVTDSALLKELVFKIIHHE